MQAFQGGLSLANGTSLFLKPFVASAGHRCVAIETLLLTVTFVSPLSNLTFRVTLYPVVSRRLPVSLALRVPTVATNSLLKRPARTAVPSGLIAGRLRVFLSQRGVCSLGVSPPWPGRVAAKENGGLPHHPWTGLICNYLLQCSGRLRFVPVQNADYQGCTRCYHADGFPQSSAPSSRATTFLIRFSRRGIVELLIKAPACYLHSWTRRL